MKKIFIGVLFLSVVSFGSSYYAKVEPVDSYTIQSSVSGKVLFVFSEIESQKVEDATIVQLDDTLEKIELKHSLEKLKNMEETLKLQKKTLESFKKVSAKSQFDKDNQKIVILNTASNISDLQIKIATLQDLIKNKKFVEKQRYIYDIAVQKGEYVTPGKTLYTAQDISKGKVEIFIPIDDAATLSEKKIFIDDKESDLVISKLYSVADSKHISSYKCEIIIPHPEKFSKLIKIEFR